MKILTYLTFCCFLGLVVGCTKDEVDLTNNFNKEENNENLKYLNEISEIQNSLNLMPNPTRDYIEIVGISNGQFQFVKLFDDKGREVLSNCNFKNNKLDVSSLSSGTYFVTFSIENYEVVKKFIKL